MHVELFDSGQTMIKGGVEDTEVEIEFNVELRPSNFFDEARPWRPGEPPRHDGHRPWDVEGEVLVMRVAKVAGRKYTIQETAAELERAAIPEAAVTAFAKYVDDLVELVVASRRPRPGSPMSTSTAASRMKPPMSRGARDLASDSLRQLDLAVRAWPLAGRSRLGRASSLGA